MTSAVDCCRKVAAHIGLSPLARVLSLNPFPPQVAVPISLSCPSALDLPVLPILTSLNSLPFPWEVTPMEPLHSPCFTALRSTQRRASGITVGQGRPARHPIQAVEEPSPTAVGPWNVYLWGHFSGGVWHDAWLRCCLQLAAPTGLSPLTAAIPLNPVPPHAAAPIGLSPPCALPLPAWPTLTSLFTLPSSGGGGGARLAARVPRPGASLSRQCNWASVSG